MSLRDAIRAKVLGTPAVRRSVTIEHDGMKFVLLAPTISQRSALVKSVGMVAGADPSKIDPFLLMVNAIIEVTHDEAGARVFEPADREVLLNQPAGTGIVDVLGEAAMSILNLNRKAETDAKN